MKGNNNMTDHTSAEALREARNSIAEREYRNGDDDLLAKIDAALSLPQPQGVETITISRKAYDAVNEALCCVQGCIDGGPEGGPHYHYWPQFTPTQVVTITDEKLREIIIEEYAKENYGAIQASLAPELRAMRRAASLPKDSAQGDVAQGFSSVPDALNRAELDKLTNLWCCTDEEGVEMYAAVLEIVCCRALSTPTDRDNVS